MAQLDIDAISGKVRKLRDHYHLRDARYADLLAIRQGNIQQVFPDIDRKSTRLNSSH